MKQQNEIKKLIKKMEKPDKNTSFLLAVEVVILKNKKLLKKLVK